jgi:DNA-directed RNA polymerase subunit RPC12/RpoP
MGLFDSIKKDDDFIKYLSVTKNLEEFLWSINKYEYDFPQIIKYCCDLVINKRNLSRHNREAAINAIREELDFYVNIYTNLTGINKFKKPEKIDIDDEEIENRPPLRPITIDWDSKPDYFLFLCPHCHKEFSMKQEESIFHLLCPYCGKNVSVHNLVSS